MRRRRQVGGRWWLLAGLLVLIGLLGGPSEAAQAAVLTVTTNDGGPPVVDGQCSLREAIQNARLNALTHADCLLAGQAAPAVDEIQFTIGGGGPQTILLASALDTLTGGPLVLDASTQPGPGALPLITLDGVGAGAGVSGFEATGADVTIRGFAIVRFGGSGILINAGAQRTVIEGNFVGIDRLSQTAQPNANGISLASAFTTTIGGTTASQRNVISGNTGDGIRLTGSNTSTIQGNYIGTNSVGTTAVPNGGDGIEAGPTAFSALIGGTAAGAGNVISGNGGHGIFGSGANVRLTIQGNRIGTNATGSAAIPNGGNGVHLDNTQGPVVGGAAAGAGNQISGNGLNGVLVAVTQATIQGNVIGLNAAGTAALANQQHGILFQDGRGDVGGADAAARNVIAGNGQSGIAIDAQSSNVGIRGNFIGTNQAGTAAVANLAHGILVSGTNHGIGGSTVAEGNLISGNGQHGISFESAQLTDVRNNRIGLHVTALSGIPNGSAGISAVGSNRIGIGAAQTAGRGNTIAFNTGAGISVSATSERIGIVDNSIFSNGGLGIDLAPAGVSPNDAGDGDGGANTGQNFPVITAASVNGTLIVAGSLNTTPSTNGIRIQLFGSTACDPAGSGEGQTFLGEVTVTTDAGGDAAWSASGLPAVAAGTVVTATASSPSGLSFNTSEFSPCRTVVAAGTGQIAVSPAQIVTSESGGTDNVTIVLGSQPADTVTIPLTSSDTTEGTLNVTQVVFTPQNWNVPQAVTVTGVDDGIVDGDVAYTIVTGPAVSNDPAFNGLNPLDVSATNTDNDAAAVPSPTATPVSSPDDPNNAGQGESGKPKNERADETRETETTRQQRERTNRSGMDDYRTEGNVVEVDLEASPRTATIATRDGLQVIVLLCRDGCDDPQVGDYLEAGGVKEHEALFYADSVTSRRPGR